MLATRRGRVGALVVVGCLVGAVLVGAGTIPSADLAADYEAHIGDQVQIDGTVVGTDPVRIDHDGLEVTVAGAEAVTDGPIERGDRLVVYGTVEPDRTITAVDAVRWAGWESQYLYAVSLVGALWVFGRFLRGWRLDTGRLAFEPRSRPDREEGAD